MFDDCLRPLPSLRYLLVMFDKYLKDLEKDCKSKKNEGKRKILQELRKLRSECGHVLSFK